MFSLSSLAQYDAFLLLACKDDDGTVWQVSTSIPSGFTSQPGAMRAIDRYWAYKLEPNGDGTTKTTLICQTILNGWIPRFMCNRLMCSTLIDYMTTVVERLEQAKASGEHAKILEQMHISNL